MKDVRLRKLTDNLYFTVISDINRNVWSLTGFKSGIYKSSGTARLSLKTKVACHYCKACLNFENFFLPLFDKNDFCITINWILFDLIQCPAIFQRSQNWRFFKKKNWTIKMNDNYRPGSIKLSFQLPGKVKQG